MVSLFRKSIVAGVASVALCGLVAASATPAAAQYRHGWGWGGPVAAGVVGGLALGAIVGHAAEPAYGYGYGYGYAPPVVYDAPPPAYAPACWLQRQPVYSYNGDVVGYRRVRVCR